MGQSALRDRRTPFRERGIERDVWQIRPLLLSKGNRVNIPDPDTEIDPQGSSAVTQTNSETTAGVLGRVLSSL